MVYFEQVFPIKVSELIHVQNFHPANIYLFKLTVETPENSAKYVQG